MTTIKYVPLITVLDAVLAKESVINNVRYKLLIKIQHGQERCLLFVVLPLLVQNALDH